MDKIQKFVFVREQLIKKAARMKQQAFEHLPSHLIISEFIQSIKSLKKVLNDEEE